MLRLLTDEHVPRALIRAAQSYAAGQGLPLDLLTVKGAGLAGTPDPALIAWAAAEGRVIVTGDVNTLVGHANDRVRAGEPMAGVLVVRRGVPARECAEHLALAACARESEEMRGRVSFVPGDD